MGGQIETFSGWTATVSHPLPPFFFYPDDINHKQTTSTKGKEAPAPSRERRNF